MVSLFYFLFHIFLGPASTSDLGLGIWEIKSIYCIWVFHLRVRFGGFSFWVWLRMMSMTCHNLDFGFTKTVFDLYACGCSSNASFCRSSVRNYAKSSSSSRKLVDRRRGIALCRVSSTKTPATLLSGSKFCVKQYYGSLMLCVCAIITRNDIWFLVYFCCTNTEVAQGVPPLLDLKKASSGPISLKNLFELVADDLQTLNQNLQSVSTPL